ncbi:MAG: type III pantothenate kinase [Myxococcota bacterium]
MLLVVDVGNSNTVLGAYDGERLVHTWRIATLQRTTDELGLVIMQLLALDDVDKGAIEGVAVCSVVPSTNYALDKACRRYLKRTPRFLDARADLGIAIRVDNPAELGADRVVNCLAARTRIQPPFLIVDFGTATTFDCVDADGAYVGGAIAPGLQISADALISRTSRLPRTEVQRPKAAIGTNTVAAIQSGVFWGYVGLVDGLAKRCKKELGGKVPCVATGGLSNLVGRACAEIDEVDEHLTLHGLRLWYTR